MRATLGATGASELAPGAHQRLVELGTRAALLGTLTLVGVALLVWGGRGFPDQPMSFLRGPAGFAMLAVIAATYAIIGSFLATHLPGHAVGWSLILIGLGVALHMPSSLAVSQAVSSFRPIPPALLIAVWSLTSAFVPLAVALIAYALIILPDGHLPARRGWAWAIVTLTGFHVLTFATALEPSGLVWFPTLPNPLGVPTSLADGIALARTVGVVILAAGLVLAATVMVARYRRAGQVARRQLQWIAAGAIAWVVTLVPLLFVRYLTGATDDVGSAVTLIAGAGTLAIPVTIFVATARYHLFGIHAFAGRTLVYVPLMGVCGGLYAGGLALSQRLFVLLTGNTSDMAIVLATLLMAAVITPARRVLETAVERLVAPDDEAEAEDAYHEYRRLAAQAAELTARMAEVEQRLDRLPPPRDQTLELGEPGVGRGPATGQGSG